MEATIELTKDGPLVVKGVTQLRSPLYSAFSFRFSQF